MVVSSTTQVSLERNGQHMMIIDALVRLGIQSYNLEAYRSISASLGVSFRIVRRAHDAHWPLIDKMIELERENIQLRADYEKLRIRVFSGIDHSPEPIEMSDEAVDVAPINMERQHMDMALATVEKLRGMGIVAGERSATA